MAVSRGERQIKRAKSVQAEAWCERKCTRRAETAPGRIPLTDLVQEPICVLASD